jgi:curved DNA-binding protein CbpA/CheY-like chemotaxis protein
MAATETAKASILIIGQDPSLQTLAFDHLREQGHDVRLAARGIDGLTEYRSNRPDLVIIDATRPTEAFGLFGLMREVDPHARAMIAGAPKDEDTLLQKMAEYGIEHHLLYPFAADHLDRAVKAVLAASAEAAVDALFSPAQERADDATQSARIWMSEGAEVPATGTLEGYRLADVLHSCVLRRKTGVLLLQRKGHQKRIYVKDGLPVFVQSSLQHETLGAYLLRHKIVSEEQHKQSVAEMMRTGKRHGEVLVDMGVMQAKEAFQHLNDHIRHKAISAFAWTEGTYRFEEVRRLPEQMMIVDMNPCELVVEGLRAHFDPKHLPADFPALDCTAGVDVENAPYDEQALALSPTAAHVRQELVAGKGVDAIVQATGTPLEEVMGITYGLYVLQVVALSDQPAEPSIEEPMPEDTSGAISLGEEDLESLDEEADSFLADYLRMSPLDCFGLLGVTPEADDAEVERAFQALTGRFDPERLDADVIADVRDKVEELWSRIQHAHNTLATEESRRDYHASLQTRGASQGGTWSPDRSKALGGEQHFRTGKAALDSGRCDEAVAAFDEALRAAPMEPAYLAYHGWALHNSDREANRGQAVEELQTALSLDPGYSGAHYFLGRICLLDGNDTLAQGYFEAAVRADPENVEAQRYLHATMSRVRAATRPPSQPEPVGRLRRLFGRG